MNDLIEKALLALVVLVVIGVMVPMVGMAVYYVWRDFFAAIGVI